MRFKCPNHWTIAQRIARRSRRDPVSGCWIWLASTQRGGYGTIGYRGRTWLAHRLAWTGAHGPVPAGKILCHRCDERRCVNPEHLFLGTWQANVDDLKAKRLRRRAAADTGRMHIFIRGLELVGDVTWENEHDLDPEKPAPGGFPGRSGDEQHGALRRPGASLCRAGRRRARQVVD